MKYSQYIWLPALLLTMVACDEQQVVNDLTPTREEAFAEDVRMESQDYIFIPASFSPDNDGEDDVFAPVILPGYKEFVEVETFKIYNRWGELVYDNDNPKIGWDGTTEGAENSVGVYLYSIGITTPDGTARTFHGNVTLLR